MRAQRPRARCVDVIGSILLLEAVLSGAPVLAAPPRGEPSLRLLAEKLLKEGSRDLLSLCGLPAGPVPESPVQGQGRVAFSIVHVRDAGSEGLVRLEVESAPSGSAAEAARRQLNLHFVREGVVWRRKGCRSADLDLADGLVAAASREERRSILAAETAAVAKTVGGVLHERGDAHFAKSEYEHARSRYELALEVAEQLSDSRGAADALLGMGAVALYLGEYTLALTHYRASLGVAEGNGDLEAASTALGNLSWVHLFLADHAEALAAVRRSLAIEESAGHEAHMIVPLGALGSVHAELGDYANSLAAYTRARRLAEKLGPASSLRSVINNLGMLFDKQGDTEQALRHYREALRMSEEAGDTMATCLGLLNVGMALVNAGQSEEAHGVLERGRRLAEELDNKSRRAEALMAIGWAHEKGSRRTLARGAYEESLVLMQELGRRAEAASLLNQLAEIRLADGEAAGALVLAERAAGIAVEIGAPEPLRQSRTVAGRAHFAEGRTDEARRSFEAAVAVTEQLRTGVAGGEQPLARYLETRLTPYYGLVELLVGEGRSALALEYAERAKARVLLDVLQKGRVSLATGMTAEEGERERGLRSVLASLNDQLEREGSRVEPDGARLADLKAQREKARLECEAFEASLYAAHPALRTRRGQLEVVGPERTASLLPDDSTALLEYAVADDRTHLFLLSRGRAQEGPRLEVFTVRAGSRELATKIRRFRALLGERSPAFAVLARELYELLLRPVEPRLRGRTTLGIVPDGPLWELPFQALQGASGRYLLEDRALYYAPSLTALGEMARRAGRSSRESRGGLLAFGNPDLGPETVDRVQSVHRDIRMAPLPEAEKEVQALGRFYGAASRVYTGAQATEARLKAEAGVYRVLHLATHGILDDTNPLYSHVVLSSERGPGAEDGVLEAREILDLDLGADLAVLSACQTGRGRVSSGEGLIGMSWALLAAGCPSAVVSQWEVDSASTTRLMVEFHRGLARRDARSALTMAQALRRAALGLLADERSRHPYYWAGFVLVGRDGPLP